MNAQTLQYIAWFVALVELIVGLYILVLNVRHTVNRHLSILMLMLSLNSFALGMFFTATDVEAARWPTIILSAVAPGVTPLLLIVAVVLLRPQWMRGWWRWGWMAIYLLVVLPILLTTVDMLENTHLLYTGLREAEYTGGVVGLFDYVGGTLAPLFRAVTNLPILLLLVGLVWVIVHKRSTGLQRTLALILLMIVLVGMISQFALIRPLGQGIALLVASTAFALAYGIIGFWYLASERHVQRGRLPMRLTLLTLAIVVPMLLAISFWGSELASDILGEISDSRLALIGDGLKNSVEGWLTQSVQTLEELTSLPDVISMDPVRQKPILRAVNAAHPQTYLVMTMDLSGMNVARSDEAALRNYANRRSFTEALQGRVVLQTLISRTTGRPALVMGAPIRNAAGEIVGVANMGSELTAISKQIGIGKIGETGEAFLVDEFNQVVAHSNQDVVTKPELVDASEWPTVLYLRQKGPGLFTFADDRGVRWRAYVDRLENGWGIVVQQQEAELQSAFRVLGRLLTTVVTLAVLLMIVLLTFAIRQALQPVNTLIAATTAVAAGDLAQEAAVESEDELGMLARAFNKMTAQLRDVIGSLEARVAARTAELERRARYLQASTEIGRAVNSLLDADQLTQQVVEVIRERLGLYYVALFTVDRHRGQAVMRAGSGEIGRALLARGYQLPLEGQPSMIAWCIANERPRIARQAEKDAVRLTVPELSSVRSEVALPLRSRGQVIGAMSLQSDRPDAFDETMLSVLQIMADQVAVALDNARLFAESQAALEQMRRAYGEISQQVWRELLHAGRVEGYCYQRGEVVPAQGAWRPEVLQAVKSGQPVMDNQDEAVLAVPLRMHDRTIGVINLRRASADKIWTEEERALVGALADQLGVTLESARLYWDTQRRAAREQLARQVVDRMRRTLTIQELIQTTVEELSVLGPAGVFVQLVSSEVTQDDQKNG